MTDWTTIRGLRRRVFDLELELLQVQVQIVNRDKRIFDLERHLQTRRTAAQIMRLRGRIK